jgi:hypothetical protein
MTSILLYQISYTMKELKYYNKIPNTRTNRANNKKY